MRNPNEKNKPPNDSQEAFTIDANTGQIEGSSTEMPSLTKLLNRKTLGTMPKKGLHDPIPPAPARMKEESSAQATLPPSKISPPTHTIPPTISQTSRPIEKPIPHPTPTQSTLTKIKPLQRKLENVCEPLHAWTLPQLKSGKDPLGHGIIFLLEKGAKSALFLTVLNTTDEYKAPIFQSSAVVRGNSQIGLWTGLRWDPNLVPETWNVFLKLGFVELAPPATGTNI